MSIIKPDIIAEKGRQDAKRHRQKQREAIKKNLPEIIADESIITSKKGKIIKIPIKAIDIPHFKPKSGKDTFGVGQGDGKPGDIIGKEKGQGTSSGKAGNAPGEEYIETEVEIEELIELMLEDLGLPNLEEKEQKQLIVDFGWRIKGRSKAGIWSLLDARATAKEGIRRFWFFLRALKQETDLPELTCFSALKKAKGIMEDALKFLHNPSFEPEEKEIEPFPILENDDLRFRKIEENIRYQSQAVIIAMMDVSGSMGALKKYLARSMLFWLTNFLRKIYEKVEIRFIIHHATAKNVDEESFFKTGESGGTYCYTAYELAGSLIETEYLASAWNVYVWHFSDGDDFDPKRTVKEMRNIFAKNISMVGYGEIKAEDGFYREKAAKDSDLLEHIKNTFEVEEIKGGIRMMVGKSVPLLSVIIEKKEHLLLALQEFLNKRRWSNE
ncbi:MAG: DUF444 family protein [Patescibacteria group bacterium]